MTFNTYYEPSKMETYAGKMIDLRDLKPEDIDMADIAHSLAMQCRFNGHTPVFYSVAEHCCHISDCALLLHDKAAARLGLMHDAAEAYTGDVIRPFKAMLGAGYKILEDDITMAIYRKFNIGLPWWPEWLKDLDTNILLDEKLKFFRHDTTWEVIGTPLNIDIQAWPPQRAEIEFFNRVASLEILGSTDQ